MALLSHASRADHCYRPSRAWAHGPPEARCQGRSEHEVHGAEDRSAHHGVALQPHTAGGLPPVPTWSGRSRGARSRCSRATASPSASTSSPTGRARPPSTATVKARASSPGPATSKRTAVPSAHPAFLPTTKGMARCTPPERDGRGPVPAPARSVEGTAGVLLVHPAVEDPHLHELGVRHLAHRAPADGRPVVLAERVQLGQPGRGHLDELGPDGRRRATARRTATKPRSWPRSRSSRGRPVGSLHSGAGSPMIARSMPMRCES